jgi:hypothetical protein
MKVTWKCGYCGDKVISNSEKRHTMDMCECNRSGYDLELYYTRTIGDKITVIATDTPEEYWCEICDKDMDKESHDYSDICGDCLEEGPEGYGIC